MFNSIFKIIYASGYVIITIVRKYYTNKSNDYSLKINDSIDFVFLILNGIGMTIPLVYILSPWLDFANYSLPEYVGWVGAFLFGLAIWLLYLSHKELSKQWTPALAIKKDHELIATGIYKHIRHPMYSAHLVWAIAQILLLHNWIVGYSFIIFFIPFCINRLKKEEQMLIDQFGIEYMIYKTKTKLLIPKIL
jgi:protein-S-isoprenylcysteine O-methyltransferase Ste14